MLHGAAEEKRKKKKRIGRRGVRNEPEEGSWNGTQKGLWGHPPVSSFFW